MNRLLQGKHPKTLLEVFSEEDDMEGFHPPKWIMTTERVAKIVQANLEKKFPGIEVIVVPDSQLNPTVLERHDED